MNQKLFNFFSRTDKQTGRHSSSYPYMDWCNFTALFDTFHFIMFASVSSFVKDKMSIILI
jgi:hypothetical protein